MSMSRIEFSYLKNRKSILKCEIDIKIFFFEIKGFDNFLIHKIEIATLPSLWYHLHIASKSKYSSWKWMWVVCCLMKQNCYFQRVMAECRHAATPLSSYSINTTHQGFQKRYITLFYLKGLKSYQPSKFKCLHFTPLSLVNRTFHLHFCWYLLSPLRYNKVKYLFWKPWSVVLML